MSEEQLWSIPDDVESIYIHYTTEDLLKGFREEALRHREEIERLKNREQELIKINQADHKYASQKEDEVIELHSIIKEAREEIEYFELQANHLDDSIYLDETLTKKLLEILDKENE